MKKTTVSIIIVFVLLILTAFIFDWGRRGPEISVVNLDATTTTISLSSGEPEMPIVVNIKDNQTVTSPIKIIGKARGNWFFEASFPIILVDTNGDQIGSAVAKADGDWMTTDFVNFTATVEYDKSTSTGRALLILSNDNPSGNPELSKSIFVPVILK